MEVENSSVYSISNDSVYDEWLPKVEDSLTKVESDPEFWDTKLKSVDIALTILKGHKKQTVNLSRYKSHWSYRRTLIRETFNELLN